MFFLIVDLVHSRDGLFNYVFIDFVSNNNDFVYLKHFTLSFSYVRSLAEILFCYILYIIPGISSDLASLKCARSNVITIRFV